MVNVGNQSVLFEYMLKCSRVIGISDLFIVDIDAVSDYTQFLKNQ